MYQGDTKNSILYVCLLFKKVDLDFKGMKLEIYFPHYLRRKVLVCVGTDCLHYNKNFELLDK